ncbi:MAG: DUF4432 family protein [Christensenella sp.]
MKIRLKESAFTEKETLFADAGELKASLMRYESGVCAVKLENSVGYITVLPFQGQMIWDAVFHGRSLKMKTSYEYPKKREVFRDTYGCYVMHCGALSMGCPSPQDDHPHHGELPYVTYDRAFIVSGEDEKGKFIGVTGEYEYNRAFGSHYIARPLAKLYENSSLIDVSMEIENMASHPMDLMYMCHVNNAPEAGAEIFQTLPWTSENMVVRVSIPQYNEPDPVFMDLLARVQEDVKVTKIINEGDVYDPEIVLFLRGAKMDEDGKAHFLYVHKDGSADYTTYDASVLNRGVRWMVNHDDWQSMGMVLPSTAEPEGYTAEKEKGNVRSLDGKKTFKAAVTVGYLAAAEAEKVKNKIDRIMK